MEWLDHTADLMIRVRGDDEADLYASAALAMTQLITEDLTGPEEPFDITVAGGSPAERLLGLLRELLFRFDVDGWLCVAALAELAPPSLTLRGSAIRFDPERHQGLREIKAVTYHQLVVRQEAGRWLAELVFDV
jgi:SHS2 domain-containing protein